MNTDTTRKRAAHFLVFLLVFITFVPSIHVHSADGFTVLVLPDTQLYSKSYPHIFTIQTEWAVTQGAILVIHEGDIVDSATSITQWNNANRSLSILNSHGVPYSVIAGNHDKSAYYNTYFPTSRFSTYGWWGGNFNGNDNNYQLFTLSGRDYLFLNLDVYPSMDELSWANETLKQYANRTAILTTHTFLSTHGSRNLALGSTNYIWNNLIRYHKNLQLVLCGHSHGESLRTDYNLAGKVVYQVLADYQERDHGGDGWLRILRFAPSENKVYITTYSPYLDQYETDSNSEFVLDFSASGLPNPEPQLKATINIITNDGTSVQFRVNGTKYSTPCSFVWTVGSTQELLFMNAKFMSWSAPSFGIRFTPILYYHVLGNETVLLSVNAKMVSSFTDVQKVDDQATR